MSIEWERRLRELEVRVDELLRLLNRPPGPEKVGHSEQPKSPAGRRRDGNGRFVR